MAHFPKDGTITEYQDLMRDLYSLPGDRNFSIEGVLIQQQRFAMRALKGIRKKDKEKLRFNLLNSFSWAFSVANRLHFTVENILWERFPYSCSYCGTLPCGCKVRKIQKRIKKESSLENKPKTLAGFQKMFEEIYPSSSRTLEHAGIHLGEEMGEVAEAVHIFMVEQDQRKEKFKHIREEVADFISCLFGVANSAGIDVAKELAEIFSDNCFECHNLPCTCTLEVINSFKS